jgi:hypothetical protein
MWRVQRSLSEQIREEYSLEDLKIDGMKLKLLKKEIWMIKHKDVWFMLHYNRSNVTVRSSSRVILIRKYAVQSWKPVMTGNLVEFTSPSKQIAGCYLKLRHQRVHWRTEGCLGSSTPPPPPKFQSFDKAEPNSSFRGKCIRNNLIRIRVSLICKLSGNPD